MKKQYAIIGLGRFGSSVASTLMSAGHEVLAIDTDEERVQRFSESVTHAVTADSTEENTLKSLGIRNFDTVIVAIGQNVQASVLTTLLLKELGVKYVVAKADTALHGKMLAKIGADKVVFPERDMGQRIAHNLMSTNVIDYLELAPDLGLIEVEVPKELFNIRLRDTRLRADFGITVVAIRRKGKRILSPNPEEEFLEGDNLILVGESTGIQRFEAHFC